jgi:DnaK suppressor protein
MDDRVEIDEARARELLKRERDRIEVALAGHEDSGREEGAAVQESASPEDDAELVGEEQVDDALVRSLRSELEAVERAEQRLEEGTYGLSVDSGEPITPQRLEAVPWAERTKEEQERLGSA